MKNANQIRKRVTSVRRAVALVVAAARAWTILWLVILVIQGVLPALTVWISKLLIDGLVVAIDAKGSADSVRPLIALALLMGALVLVGHILSSVAKWARIALSETFRDNLRGRIHRQAVALDLEFYESSAYHDRLHRVLGEVAQRPLVMLESLGGLVQSLVTLIGMGALILVYAWWLPVVLVVGAVPALVVALRFSRRRHKWWMSRTQDERWAQYYETVLTHSSIAAEVRLFDLGGYFRDVYQELRARLRKERIDLERKQVLESIGAGLAALMVTAAVMVWITLRALRGLATLGDIALFYQAFSRGLNLMRTLLVSVSQVYDSSLFVSELFEFLALKSTLGTGAEDGTRIARPGAIALQDVSFTYPGSQTRVLRNVNLRFERDRTIAIVGENGAGKSTVLKLLCRFYDPQGGQVLIDDVPMTDVPAADVRRMSTVLFQFPVQYHASAADNIAYGEYAAPADIERVHAAAASSGIKEKIDSLPAGFDTLLGRWFVDGQELSGGEWQRLAMARAFYRDAPILILDEPTSMLDSWAEAEWFNRFRGLAEGRIGIVITHRFTIARRADLIYVMKDGQVVEAGTHEELVEAGGLYAASWNEQVTQPG